MQQLKIGDTIPAAEVRGIQTGQSESAWYILRVAPQKERATVSSLKQNNVFAFYPSEEKKRKRRGIVTPYVRPIVSGYVYAKFNGRPQWDVLKMRRLVLGVVMVEGRPFQVPSTVIKHLQGLSVEVQELERAKAELRAKLFQVSEGDRVQIMEGPLKGLFASVDRVGASEIHWSAGAIKGSAKVGAMKKVE